PAQLRRLLSPAACAPIDHAAGPGVAQWLTAGDWRVLARPRQTAPSGSPLEQFTAWSGETVSAVLDEGSGAVWVPFDLDEAFGNYVSEAWREHALLRALSPAQLHLYYRIKPLIPRRVQIAARRRLARRNRSPEFPRWPIEDGV